MLPNFSQENPDRRDSISSEYDFTTGKKFSGNSKRPQGEKSSRHSENPRYSKKIGKQNSLKKDNLCFVNEKEYVIDNCFLTTNLHSNLFFSKVPADDENSTALLISQGSMEDGYDFSCD